jgi:GTP-binding protein
LSNAKAKVGDYAFTTLRPQLGVATHNHREFVVADIPGLIAGAADGAGVGDRFLGHIERCRVLVHLIDISNADPVEAMQIVEEELEAYSEALADKPRLVALNKIDLVDDALAADYAKLLLKAGADEVFPISGATGKGMSKLLDAIIDYLPAATVTERPAGEREELDDKPWSPI